MRKPIVVIGVGNDFRGDDGIGLAVVERLKANPIPNIDYVTTERDVLSISTLLNKYENVIIIDSLMSDDEVGAIHRFEITDSVSKFEKQFSLSHSFSVVEMIELSRILGELPDKLLLYGIVGEQYDLGTSLSPKLRLAIPKASEMIMRELALL